MENDTDIYKIFIYVLFVLSSIAVAYQLFN